MGRRQNTAITFGTEKQERWQPEREKKSDNTFSRCDTTLACDRQTDRRTDILPRHIVHAYAQHRAVKKERWFLKRAPEAI